MALGQWIRERCAYDKSPFVAGVLTLGPAEILISGNDNNRSLMSVGDPLQMRTALYPNVPPPLFRWEACGI